MKSQSETELKGKVNITKSKTEIEKTINRTQSETELEGAFHRGGSSLCFHPHPLLLGGLSLGLDLPLPIDPNLFQPGMQFEDNHYSLLQNLSLLLNHGPLNLSLLFCLRPQCIYFCRLSCAWNVLSF